MISKTMYSGRSFYSFFFSAFLSIYFFVILSSVYSANRIITVKDISFQEHYSHANIVVYLDGRVISTTNCILHEKLLYFDLKNSHLDRKAKKTIFVDSQFLNRIRVGQFDSETVRLVLHTKKFYDYRICGLREPHRFIITLFNRNYNKWTSDLHLNSYPRVVIDPGHGGNDMGASGPSGLLEKDVVLDIAKRIRQILLFEYNFEVILTRERDTFIPLNIRTKKTNFFKADLFISIHANASLKKHISGIETYILNWTDNKEALKVAERENQIFSGKKKMIEFSHDNHLQVIFNDLLRDYKRDKSLKLAKNVHDSLIFKLESDFDKIVDKGIRQAMFYVLLGAKMPSILSEVSYISNRKEEKRLKNPYYRQHIAEGISKGIINYIYSYEFVKNHDEND